MNYKSIIFLSTADWDNPFWTNKQHVAVELARAGYSVFYVDSLGLRPISSTKNDFRRIFRRLSRIFNSPKQVRPNLWVLSPTVFPYHGNSFFRFINRIWLNFIINYWSRKLRLKFYFLWTYNPLTVHFLNISEFCLKVYHCVDEIKAQPKMPRELLERSEKQLIEASDFVFTTSHSLTRSRQKINPQTFYFPNVVDFEHFNTALGSKTTIPDDLSYIPSPRIGFVGALSRYKIDFKLLHFIAKTRSDWSVILIGQVGEGDPDTDISFLSASPNIHILGPRSYHSIPSYLSGFDVALLPNLMNEYTEAMFPMKFFEYLASGTPIVSVNLPALIDFYHLASFVSTPEEFVEAIERALAGDVPDLDARLDAAKKHTYRDRTEQMLSLIDRLQNSDTEIST